MIYDRSVGFKSMTKVSREEIVSAARDMFRDRGYAGASIGDIAAALGLRKASLYSRVENKAELANAAIVMTSAEFAIPQTETDDWRLAYGEAMHGFADHLAAARRCIGLHLLYDATIEPAVRAELERFFAALERRLVDLAEKALGPERAQRLAQEALCILEGGTLWLLLNEDRDPLDRLVSRFCANLPVEATEADSLNILSRYGLHSEDATLPQARMAAEIALLEGELVRLRGALAGRIEAESCFL